MRATLLLLCFSAAVCISPYDGRIWAPPQQGSHGATGIHTGDGRRDQTLALKERIGSREARKNAAAIDSNDLAGGEGASDRNRIHDHDRDSWPAAVLILAIAAGGLCMWGLHSVIVKGDDPVKYDVDVESSLVFGGEAPPDAVAEAEKLEEDGPPRCGVHRVPWQQYFALAFWCIMILTLAAFTRLVCFLGVPHDCHGHSDLVLSVYDTHLLLAYGFVLAVLTGVLQADRFEYVFCFRGSRPWGVLFLAVFFLSSPFFGLLDLVPFLTHFSLSAGNASGMFNLLLLSFLVLGAVGLVGWHLWYAFQNNPLNGFLAYTLSRMAVCLIYVSYFAAAYGAQEISFHFHHYLVAFLCAIFGEFNHPLSLVLLAAGAGIMVQGIAAYDADPMINIARRS